jgi:hypothetical protein
MTLFPFNNVPPISLPTTYPVYAPVTIVTGHFCHSRSLSALAYTPHLLIPRVYSPIQRDGHSPSPSAHDRPDQAAIHLINRQHHRHNLPPCLSVNTVNVYEWDCGEQCDVRAAEERVRVMGCYGCAEEDERCGKERSRDEK